MSAPLARTIGFLAVTVASIAAALLALNRPPLRVRVLDPRFRVISARLLHGTNDYFYPGNQLDGRVREFLRFRAHLPLKAPPNVARVPTQGQPNDDIFAICFEWDSTHDALNEIGAQWMDTPGKIIPVGPGSSGVPLIRGGWAFFQTGVGPLPPITSLNATGLYIALWHLDFGRATSGRHRFRLKRSGFGGGMMAETTGAFLAEVEIRNLPASRQPSAFVAPNGFRRVWHDSQNQ